MAHTRRYIHAMSNKAGPDRGSTLHTSRKGQAKNMYLHAHGIVCSMSRTQNLADQVWQVTRVYLMLKDT